MCVIIYKGEEESNELVVNNSLEQQFIMTSADAKMIDKARLV